MTIVFNRAYVSQLQSRSRNFSLSDVENVLGQPRGDSSRVAAVRVPSLLGNALLRPLKSGHVGAVTPDGIVRSSKDLGLDLGGSILGDRLRRPFLGICRRFIDVLLPLVPRRSLGCA